MSMIMSNSIHKNILQHADKIEHDFNLNIDKTRITPYIYVNKYKNQVKKTIVQNTIHQWKEKPLHSQFIRNIDSTDTIDKNKTLDWLKMGKLKCETEAYILSAQDQSLRTKYYDKHILKLNNDDRCRLCKTQPEHIHHIVSGFEALAKHECLQSYITRYARAYITTCVNISTSPISLINANQNLSYNIKT